MQYLPAWMAQLARSKGNNNNILIRSNRPVDCYCYLIGKIAQAYIQVVARKVIAFVGRRSPLGRWLAATRGHCCHTLTSIANARERACALQLSRIVGGEWRAVAQQIIIINPITNNLLKNVK